MANQEFNENELALAWKKMANEKFNQSPLKKEEIMNAITNESRSNIAELKKRIKYKIYWTVFFIVTFGGILLSSFSNPDLAILLEIIVGAYILGFTAMLYKYLQIKDAETDQENLLQSVKYNARLVKSVLNFEKTWGAIVMTPMILTGILGGAILKGRSLAEVVNDPQILLLGIITIVVFTPLMLWATHKMNSYAFGKLIKKLDDNIVKMELLD